MTNIDEKELDFAAEKAEESKNIFLHTFKKPVSYNGKTYEKLEFDFESLTGADALNIENELQAIGKPVVVPAFSGEYLIRMAAKACSEPVGSDIFMQMSLHDYNSIRSAARSFLLKSE